MKLAIGTVQFGLPYGISNQTGQVSFDGVSEILKQAWQAGIDTLDTAIVYGNSEQRLGEIGVTQWRVISKLPVIPESCIDIVSWVQSAVGDSLARLKLPKLYGLLLHRSEQLLTPRGEILYRALMTLKEQGQVNKIGVSVYDPDELDALLPYFEFDVIQAPFNILDRRLAISGWLMKLHQQAVEVHTRSVFLQGLLLIDATKRPSFFNQWQSLWVQWDRWLEDLALTPLQVCLGWVLSQLEIDRVLIGVDNVGQLQQILDAAKMSCEVVPPFLITQDLRLLNPSNWEKL